MGTYDIIDDRCVFWTGVTEIEDNFFSENGDFSEVVFPETLKRIGKNAFEACYRLKSVKIPASVTEIGAGAFSGCGLTEIEVDSRNKKYKSISNACLTKDGRTLVFGCRASTIPDTVETIGESAFSYCGLDSVITIPSSVIKIECFAFAGNDSITNIILPDSLETIEEKAFYGCMDMSSIVIPGSVNTIGKDAFEGCSKLKNLDIKNGVKKIEESAFSNCPITAVKFPAGISIGAAAFFGCKELTSIELPADIVNIGKHAFGDCRIKTISLPSGGPGMYGWLVTAFDNGAFSGCGIDTDAIELGRFQTKVFGTDFLVNGNINLKVPGANISDYLLHPFFKEFKSVQPL